MFQQTNLFSLVQCNVALDFLVKKIIKVAAYFVSERMLGGTDAKTTFKNNSQESETNVLCKNRKFLNVFVTRFKYLFTRRFFFIPVRRPL